MQNVNYWNGWQFSYYRKIPEYSDTRKIAVIILKIWIIKFYHKKYIKKLYTE